MSNDMKDSKATLGDNDYHLRPAKECPHCKGTGRFTAYWPDGSVCTDKAFCPHPDTNPKACPVIGPIETLEAIHGEVE